MSTALARVVSRNPADPSDVLVETAAPGAFAAANAVERARTAQPGWLRAGAAARSAALGAIAAAVEAAADELTALAVRSRWATPRTPPPSAAPSSTSGPAAG
ncbi:aldehyde dehydrogenase family protein [Streptomyces sp. NPDC058000]|uniref:aldehyde dehydrogenase family protein n=1 Tax=Streptomyces sp. NPDC058000 TaxID=3346299 RepID=UPI0036F18B88